MKNPKTPVSLPMPRTDCDLLYRVPVKTNLPDYYTRTSAVSDSAIEIVKRQGYAVLPDRTPVVRRRPPF